MFLFISYITAQDTLLAYCCFFARTCRWPKSWRHTLVIHIRAYDQNGVTHISFHSRSIILSALIKIFTVTWSDTPNNLYYAFNAVCIVTVRIHYLYFPWNAFIASQMITFCNFNIILMFAYIKSYHSQQVI